MCLDCLLLTALCLLPSYFCRSSSLTKDRGDGVEHGARVCELNLVARAAQHDEFGAFDGAVQGVGVSVWIDDEVGVARDDHDGQSYRIVLRAERREARVESCFVAERGFNFARPRPERLRLFKVAHGDARGRERFFEAVSDLPANERTRR